MYFELRNAQRQRTLDQTFTSKVDAELFCEERRLEHPDAMKGWTIWAVFLPRLEDNFTVYSQCPRRFV